MTDMVNHPPHYKQYSFEVIELTERLPFCAGNAVKYILRAPFKGSLEQDIDKAIWYLDRAIQSQNCLPVSSQVCDYSFDYLAKLALVDMNKHARASVVYIVTSAHCSEFLKNAKRELRAWRYELKNKDQSE